MPTFYRFLFVGEEFLLEHTRTWEFNNTMPIRSMVVPYIIYKIPMSLFRLLSMYLRYFLRIDICTPYAIFVLPRLVMCSISFLNDWSLYKTCKLYGLRYDIRLLALASSYVIIVFGTRTFSNSIEMALCSLLLYVVADCMTHTNNVIFQREFLDEKYKKSQTTLEKVKVYKMRALLPSHTIHKCSIVSTIFVVGFFNRPTFLFFGMPIVFFWMVRGLGTKTVSFVDFNLRFISLFGCGIPIVILFIIVDSMYYGFLTLSDVDYLDISINSFVVTPLNFVRYNIDSSNTAAHGVHPKYLHLLVNIPLLFNVLGIAAIVSFLHLLYRFVCIYFRCLNLVWLIPSALSQIRFSQNHYRYLPRAQSVVALMNATIFVPVAILSLINHQEARFLLPITFPVIILHAPTLMNGWAASNPFKDTSTIGQFIYHHFLCTKASADRLLKSWYTINIALVVFFGIIHQGGVIQLTQYLQQNALNFRTDTNTNVYLITSHLYNIPTSYLFFPSTKVLLTNPDNGQKYTRKKQFFLYEYGNSPMDELQQQVKLLLDANEIRKHQSKMSKSIQTNYKLYLAIPSSLTEELSIALFKSNHTTVKYQRIKMFYPHLSIEAFPNFFLRHLTEIRTDVFNLDQKCEIYDNRKEIEPYSLNAALRQFSAIVHQFGLVLYRVELRRKNTFSEWIWDMCTKQSRAWKFLSVAVYDFNWAGHLKYA